MRGEGEGTPVGIFYLSGSTPTAPKVRKQKRLRSSSADNHLLIAAVFSAYPPSHPPAR